MWTWNSGWIRPRFQLHRLDFLCYRLGHLKWFRIINLISSRLLQFPVMWYLNVTHVLIMSLFCYKNSWIIFQNHLLPSGLVEIQKFVLYMKMILFHATFGVKIHKFNEDCKVNKNW
jgi:hypothetical protein